MTSAIRMALAIFILALAAAPLPGLAAELNPFKAIYDLTYGGVTAGEAVYELTIDSEGNVLYHARVEPRGIAAFFTSDIVSEQSRLRLEDDGSLTAISYEYLQDRNGKSVERKDIEFDWESGQALTRVDGDQRRVDIERGVVDRMSLQLKLMMDRLSGNEDNVLVYQVIEDHELREYRFEVKGRSRISTAAGDYDTVRLERRHGSRTTVFWSAPSLGYLPVRVEQRRDSYPTSRMDLSRVAGPLVRRPAAGARP